METRLADFIRETADGRDADAILRVCRLYAESPLPCVTGLTGANLKKRIEEIMANRRMYGPTCGRKLLLDRRGRLDTPIRSIGRCSRGGGGRRMIMSRYSGHGCRWGCARRIRLRRVATAGVLLAGCGRLLRGGAGSGGGGRCRRCRGI